MPMTPTPGNLMSKWLERQLPVDSVRWLNARREELRSGFTDRALHITLGMIPRRLGKTDLVPDVSDPLPRARPVRTGIPSAGALPTRPESWCSSKRPAPVANRSPNALPTFAGLRMSES